MGSMIKGSSSDWKRDLDVKGKSNLPDTEARNH